MNRRLHPALALWRAAVQRDLEFRGNFVLSLLTSVLLFATGIFVVMAFFDNGRSFRGWSFHDMVLLFGVYQTVLGIVLVVFRPGLSQMSEFVRTGQLEYILTRPIDAQVYISFSHVDLWFSPTLVLGLGTVGYVFATTGLPDTTALIFGFIALLAGIAICYSIMLMINTLAIWVVRVNSGDAVFGTVLQLSYFPVRGLPGALEAVFVWIIPIFFITNLPTLILRGEADWLMFPFALGMAALFVLVSRVLFVRALRSFTGAGG
ncbi:MAG: ABC-2 family transporter protein [Rhodospirillaceae bacterium]|nr:ABC-2 family transporter protein [Rhodospirillaceae bacterium]